MQKGIIFSGCSFTWGQGLWMYYDKDIKIPMSIEYTGGKDNMDVEWKSTRVPEEAYELHKTLGWPTKVAEYLNGTPIIKRYNGGNDEESIRFINEVFGNNDVSVNKHSMVKKNYDIENVDYIFFQTTQPYRCDFEFKYNNKDYKMWSTPNLQNFERVSEMVFVKGQGIQERQHSKKIGERIFIDWLIDNNYTFDDFEKIHTEQVMDRVESVLKKYSEMGKKVYLLNWTWEYWKAIKDRPFLKNIHIPFNYKGFTYNSIHELQMHYTNTDSHCRGTQYCDECKGIKMMIDNDKDVIPFNRPTHRDEHPSKLCHEIIAENIINKLKDE